MGILSEHNTTRQSLAAQLESFKFGEDAPVLFGWCTMFVGRIIFCVLL